MPFETLQAYKNAIFNNLQLYQDDYHFFKNKHHQAAEDFKLKINESTTKHQLSENLYNFYLEILHKNSRDLAKSIALILAEEWNLPLREVIQYHELRANPGEILNSVWFGGKYDEYFGGKRYWDHIEGVINKDEGDSQKEHMRTTIVSIHDPIIVAFKKLQCLVTEPNELELSETSHIANKPGQ